MYLEWMRYAGWLLTCPVLLMTLAPQRLALLNKNGWINIDHSMHSWNVVDVQNSAESRDSYRLVTGWLHCYNCAVAGSRVVMHARGGPICSWKSARNTGNVTLRIPMQSMLTDKLTRGFTTRHVHHDTTLCDHTHARARARAYTQTHTHSLSEATPV